MKTKPGLLVMALRGLALYAFSYALYWSAAWEIGGPHEFRNLWAKSLIPLGVVIAALYFNKTNQTRGR
ncbi:MAG: hypothetical protein ACRYFS_13650 [Janthinobacterium lividum]